MAVTTQFKPIRPTFGKPKNDRKAKPYEKMSPGAKVAEAGYLGKIDRLASKNDGKRYQSTTNLRAGLTGYNRYSVADNGEVKFDSMKDEGTLERREYRMAMDQAGGESTFAARRVGEAIGKLHVQAQQMINQHRGTFNDLVNEESNEYDDILGDLTKLWGDEASYLIEEPPPDIVSGLAPGLNGDPNSAPAKLWHGKQRPNRETLQRTFDQLYGGGKYSMEDYEVRRHGDGSYGVYRTDVLPEDRKNPGGAKYYGEGAEPGRSPNAPKPPPSGRITTGAKTTQQQAVGLAQRYSQQTGQHWSISKQNGRWVVYRVK